MKHGTHGAAPECDAAGVPAGGAIPWESHLELRRTGSVWGMAAGLGLLAVYGLFLGFVNSFQHAVWDFIHLWPWMTALTLGFATQVGLFAYSRSAARGATFSGTRGVVASGGTSAVSMIACCAHHLTDILPVVGLTGATIFLAAYQPLFLLLGVLSNIVGIVYVLGMMRKHHLYPAAPSLLSLSVRWPADRALPYVLAGAVLTFGLATVITIR